MSALRTKSWGGLETKPFYGPADVRGAYEAERGDPGAFRYTRGAYPKMYRSRMWTLRNIVGYGAPEDTREGLEKVLGAGGGGVSIVVDPLTTQSIDPDHPAFAPEVGLEGCSLPTARDIDRLLHGVDQHDHADQNPRQRVPGKIHGHPAGIPEADGGHPHLSSHPASQR